MKVILIMLLMSLLPVVPGNIDINNREVVVNSNGSFSTELSFSIEFDGYEVLLPQVINGEIVSEEEAIEHYLLTGEHLGMFSCWQAAEVYAELLHLWQEEYYK